MSPVRGSLEASLVRIRTADGRVIGAGFLVGERRILTCAHVIIQALGLVNYPLDPPQGLVSLDFPLLPPRTLCTAKVALWYPPLPDGGGDIAGLELHREPPAGAEVVRFASAEDVWEHPFRAFGFPRGYDDGVWATGRLLGRQSTNWIMIEDIKAQGFGITPGFSGTPVWDTQLQGVVGMVVAMGRPADAKSSFVIPVDVLVAAWPLIKVQESLDASLVRIRTTDGRVVGAGFLVGEHQILTCAHVISQALELADAPVDLPQGVVLLDFPLLPPSTLCTAKVVLWFPPLPDGRGDIAGLELQGEPQAGAEAVRFASAEDVWEHPFRAFGFPAGYDDGVWATGRLLGRQATGWVMIDGVKAQGFDVTPGFSGTPVWDTHLQGVVGMVVAASRGVAAAFVIPVDVLVAAWPLIKDQIFQRIFPSAAPPDNPFPKSLITAEQTIKDTVEKRQDIVKDATFIYGPVQGFVQGEHNTVTLIFQDSKVHTMPFLAPPQPPYNLVGRDELIRELKQQLFQGGNLALSALNGLPGIGKTALALAIAHDREVLGHFCDGVLWAGLGRESNVFSYLGTWGMALDIPKSEIEKLTSLTMLAETIHRAIGTRRMLLVVDDAWSPEDALAFKLGGPYCAHIVTTRLPEVAERFASEGTITVRELDEDDSLRLLEKVAPGVSAKAPDEVREIIQAVDGLPLPLILMGNYVRIQIKTEQPRRLRTALDRLLRVKERLQLEQPQGGLERHPSLPEGIPLSQLAVIKISDEALDEETQQVLRSLSVFPSKPNTFSEEAALAVAATHTQAIDTLHDFGLLESSGPARYTLHQTISDYAQINLSDPTAYERMVAFFIEYVQAHKADRDLLERETNNILAAVEIMLERGMNPPGASAFAYFIRIVRRTRAI